ncbi:ABC transporter ATP-binding protein [Actinomadura graeca]|uniref:ABC transporter ATP-binding protein n=1 Tax=Actinomadura graeca TaxID=2750812 RepID=A0ABX8RBV5_9ACTN|nr:ABC transporter ATP-binding protein [Actinomadura graeca]
MIEARDLTVRYGTATAVDEVSFTVGRGEMVALIGPNGAGKTSLVNAVMGLLWPVGGHVAVHGRAALVPEGRQVYPDLPVEDNLILGAWRSRRDRRSRDTDWVYRLLPDLVKVRDQRAGSLSGGQQQMVAVGRALMARPDVLVVDELSLGLAPKVTADLVAHLTGLNAEQGLAVLLIEQNARLALDVCARGYVLEAGRIRVDGTAAELRDNSEVADAYLGDGT